MLKNNQRGFTGFEVVLLVLVLILLGAGGYYAYQAQHSQSTDYPVNVPHKKASPLKVQPAKVTTAQSQQYFTIKEWGVRAPYNGTDQFTYKISGSTATVVSRQLAAKNSGCASFGAGQIIRLQPTDGAYASGDGPTVEQNAKQNPGMYTAVGGYYYQFVHDQAVCTAGSSVDAQNQANSAVQSLVSQFQPAS